ncbi:FAD:protein FMN transferase [Pseudooceanicola sp. 216_PA32_1]|uniref:FAD:protein FMN transferase n=1 Tax=Pseudooceanicola pacificus TaxID=2676438 RepID=A0A844W0T2_9RHOB|nr:FAD:protein FMN transferase [Pseudooceanicola pacificus]MWB76431.1 FAD:protein FMN transferase [Pseudooceanicola pacificus]
MNRRRFLTIAACAAVLPVGARAVDWRGQVFGADARITLTGPGDAAAALNAVRGELRRLEALFSLHDPGSELSRLNRAGRLERASPDMRAILAECDRAWRLTGGAFDPTVQPLWRALAEGRDPRPAADAVGWDGVRMRDGAVSMRPGQALTLNGIAQGYAADRVAALLAGRGYRDALVDMGEMAALGGPFRVGVADPVQGLLAQETLRDAAIATSSPGAMSLGAGGHILGPSGQVPLWSTVSVMADSATRADALSTALCLCDRATAHRLLRDGMARRILLVDEAGNLISA